MRVFDGIPILIDYSDYINIKDLDSYKEAQRKRQESKIKILKYMTYVGRLRGIQFILRTFDKSDDAQRESLSDYLESLKQELEITNETLISDCLYKAYKLRNILKEYYQVVGQLSICDSIQKQLQPFFLPAYFKINWYIDSWNMIFHSIIEKEKVVNKQNQLYKSFSSHSLMSKPQTQHVTTSGGKGKAVSKSPHAINQHNLLKISSVKNKLNRVLQLIEECRKKGAEQVKDD